MCNQLLVYIFPPLCVPAYSCNSNLRFSYTMQACNHTCRSLSGPDPTCDMSDEPVEGCGCPSGTHLNTPLKCSPRALCSCNYPGGTTPPGPVVIDGRQWYAVLIICCSNTAGHIKGVLKEIKHFFQQEVLIKLVIILTIKIPVMSNTPSQSLIFKKVCTLQ